MGNVHPVHHKCHQNPYCSMECLIYNEKLRKRASKPPHGHAYTTTYLELSLQKPMQRFANVVHPPDSCLSLKQAQVVTRSDSLSLKILLQIEKTERHIARLQKLMKARSRSKRNALATQITVHTERLRTLNLILR